ncbi:signal transduction histidine kinase [Rhizobium sp. PDO1-076]|uniref:sensor histidine kinase n=1 Tax=Rhizobium sp. PDO1-076 TaxID=1125979 RepID=UPI00024E35F1|nr:sensor histidine kinase [Rhizobium sp. PDO1-076]EHS50802.1 signal transduction histidine kinase [Rhizobium sp. PDO1-076]
MKVLTSYLGRLFPTASIGTYLAIMAVLSTLPLLGFVVFLLLELERGQFQALKIETAQDAQTVSRNVERAVSDMSTTLTLVANSAELQQGNLAAFHRRVSESLKGSSLYILLVRADGTQLLNTRLAFGTALPKMSNIASLQSALSSGKTELSRVFYGATSKRWVVNLTMPLPPAKPNEPAAVVLTQDAASLASLLSTDNLPPGWTAGLLDSDGRVIVSSGPDNRPSGDQFDQSSLDLMHGANNSLIIYRDGVQYLLGYSRVADGPWSVVIWGPVASVQGSFVTIWKNLLIGSLVFLALSLCVVLTAAHQLRSAIRKIAAMAERIGHGDIVSPERTKILEANQVAFALSNASFDRAQAEERTHFILQELVHRTKNILSLVQAMMRQLARGTDNVDEFQRAVSGRLAGLAQSIEALAKQQWGGIPLSTLVDLQLMTVVGSTERVARRGPDLLANANAVQNLGLVFHELATNSVKYGALSVLEGTIAVEWTIRDVQSEQPMLEVTWTEMNGPPVTEPTRRGFGSTVVERHAAGAFGGKVSMDFNAEGLRWSLVAPLEAFVSS